MTFNQTLEPGEHTLTTYEIEVGEEQTYYVVLKDCGKLLEAEYKTQLTLYVKLTMMNNGSHVGEDEDDQWMVVWAVAVVAGWLVWRVGARKWTGKESNSVGDMDWPKAMLFIAVGSNLLALGFKGLGLAIYHTFGEDSGVLDVLYLIFHACS